MMILRSTPSSWLLVTALFVLPDRQAQAHIVGGEKVGLCGWPTAIDVNGGCTGTLIHPRAISTAQHCSPAAGQQINFGETRSQVRGTTIKRCVFTGSDDAAICELDSPIEDIPVTPVLYGCEVDNYLKEGEPVVITGYGELDDGVSNRDKYWAQRHHQSTTTHGHSRAPARRELRKTADNDHDQARVVSIWNAIRFTAHIVRERGQARPTLLNHDLPAI